MSKRLKLAIGLSLLIISFLLGTRATKISEAVSNKTKWKDISGLWEQAETGINDIINSNTGLTIVNKMTLPYRDIVDANGTKTPEKLGDVPCTSANLGEIAFFHGYFNSATDYEQDRKYICQKITISASDEEGNPIVSGLTESWQEF